MSLPWRWGTCNLLLSASDELGGTTSIHSLAALNGFSGPEGEEKNGCFGYPRGGGGIEGGGAKERKREIEREKREGKASSQPTMK